MKKMILASSNANKLREFREILSPLGWEVISQHDLGIDVDPEENGTTFEENSAIKARAVYDVAKLPTVADDSGLEVDALGGEPGVYSARYGGTRDDKVHNDIVLKKLEGVPDERRTARFVAAITYIDETGREYSFTGKFEGRIGYEERGKNGFGYDPIFMVGDISSAEMEPDQKNAVSHRGKALRALADFLSGKKTLYIADLDGTLLHDDERTSKYTNSTLNGLISKGMLFSLATSRSEVSSSIAISGLELSLPIIVYNGAAIVKVGSGEILYKHNFSKSESDEILDKLVSAGVYPIVFSFIDDTDRFSYIYDKCSAPERDYIGSKTANDRRLRPVGTVNELRAGDVFYFTCIGDPEVLWPLYRHFEHKFHCLYEVNRYSGKQWLEIIPNGVSKANAIKELAGMYGCDKTVCFGDGINDMEMFAACDECYATENAIPEIKKIATAVISSNEEDGVAKFLLENFKEDK